MTTPLRCVVDANVGIKHFIPDPLSDKVDRLLAHLAYPQTEIFVPDLFYIESANIFLKYVRAGRYNTANLQENLATIKAFPLSVFSTAELMAEAVNIALTYQISAYDASYVALAQQVLAPLLTLDQRLVNALDTARFDVRLFNEFSIPPLP